MAALSDLKVLDMTRVLAGPYCTQYLADFGATIWKIEAVAGDEARTWAKSMFESTNRGKKSIAVNFADPRGQTIIKKFAAKADVAVENFRPGTLAKYGLDFEDLAKIHKRLIAVALSGFGRSVNRRAILPPVEG